MDTCLPILSVYAFDTDSQTPPLDSDDCWKLPECMLRSGVRTRDLTALTAQRTFFGMPQTKEWWLKENCHVSYECENCYLYTIHSHIPYCDCGTLITGHVATADCVTEYLLCYIGRLKVWLRCCYVEYYVLDSMQLIMWISNLP